MNRRREIRREITWDDLKGLPASARIIALLLLQSRTIPTTLLFEAQRSITEELSRRGMGDIAFSDQIDSIIDFILQEERDYGYFLALQLPLLEWLGENGETVDGKLSAPWSKVLAKLPVLARKSGIKHRWSIEFRGNSLASRLESLSPERLFYTVYKRPGYRLFAEGSR